ncbi:phosphotransferase enzyme family protein [Kribbella kalugense]|uniref:Ser/Thr protein kinase RdoA (MazF antagonist) n=1 Tax=Kribbella kalugense TaxID=2512221 RepID=A0A4R8A053_9ACTN|nr:phosphotransferase [Kribbella kalugense]TDW23742.1 Ser/Thr protein kinase RdoA (MazF antagonist) [Kribbella kalugense]
MILTEAEKIADALARSYGVLAVELIEIEAGTATTNFQVVDETGRRWFAKVYRGELRRERAAIELAEFARQDGVPVPQVRRTRDGRLIDERAPLSLWEFVDGETAEGWISGARWPAVGTVLGRLHRRLSEHPTAVPTLRPAVEVRDIGRAMRDFDELIARFRARGSLSPFEEWACDAAEVRRALLDRAGAILADLPELTVQVVHGDLASPNLMMRGDDVAAVIDFQPPRPRFTAWEIARIGCDPRTVILGDEWIAGLAELLAAYRDEHPSVRVDDLVSTVAVGCAYTLGSTFPLAEPVVTPSLELYARARHDTALLTLDRLTEAQDALCDRLS